MKHFFLLLFLAVTSLAVQAADPKVAGKAINALGVDLFRTPTSSEGNRLISPYSIQNALAMTYAGADGDTRKEMQRVLHFPDDDKDVHESFMALSLALNALRDRSLEWVKRANEFGGPKAPFEFNVANRLFVQRDLPIRPEFLALVKANYTAPVAEMDFAGEPEPAREAINRWVEGETKERIHDFVPRGGIDKNMRMVLVNALYLRAPWAKAFRERATKNEQFLVRGRDGVQVPTMSDHSPLGYAKRNGFQLVTRPYIGRELQFLIALPDEPNGLPKFERELTPELLQECTALESHDVILHLPKFRLEPPTESLINSLIELGMQTAFNRPRGSANFDRMSPRTADGHIYVSDVIHKAFLALDEKGTEAAAATAVERMLMFGGSAERPKPVEVFVDRPFFFAIQHVPSGACLFVGRVTDPR